MEASHLLSFLLLLSSGQAAPQMERMGQPIADAYETVQRVVGSAVNVVFQLSSWFTDYETAPYTNMGEIGQDGLEERVYPAKKWVCTKKLSRSDDSDPKSGMFWSLFKYIQGGNSEGLKIEMTTPVSTLVKEDTEAGTVTYEMCFYLGEEHQASPPTPSNTRVYIKEEGERRIFTRQVGGWMNPEKWAEEKAELEGLLTVKGLSFSSDSHYQVGYDAPSKVWNRRNEVWIFSLQ